MSSHSQFGLLSIFLGILLFFAYTSFLPKGDVVELQSGMDCSNFACCMTGCGIHSIKFTSNKEIFFENQHLPVNKFIQHLQTEHSNCQVLSVSVYSEPALKHGEVVRLSNQIKQAIPGVEIAWGNSDY